MALPTWATSELVVRRPGIIVAAFEWDGRPCFAAADTATEADNDGVPNGFGGLEEGPFHPDRWSTSSGRVGDWLFVAGMRRPDLPAPIGAGPSYVESLSERFWVVTCRHGDAPEEWDHPVHGRQPAMQFRDLPPK